MLGLFKRRAERSAPVELAPVVGELFVAAQREAIALRHDFIGTEHVLLALLGRNDETAQRLKQLGLDLAGVRDDVRRIVCEGPAPETVFDADALAVVGIDLASVRERVEAAFGEGALERAWQHRGTCHGAAFGVMPRLKKALQHASNEAAIRGSEIASADVALGLASQRDSVAAQILDAHGISAQRLRAVLGDDGIPLP